MNYKSLVSSLRTAARDVLRMKLTNRRLQNVLNITNEQTSTLNELETSIKNLQKRIAINEYKLGLVEDVDPEAEEKRSTYTKENEYYTESIKTWEQTLKDKTAFFAELLAREEEGIEKIQTGETKVSKEDLLTETERLVSAITDEAVRAKLAETVAEDIETQF